MMWQDQREDLLRQALAAINKARGVLGLEPLAAMPKGYRYDEGACPIALAYAAGGHYARMGRMALTLPRASEQQLGVLRAAWHSSGAWHTAHQAVIVPPVLSRFRYAFDAGEYPELVAPLLGTREHLP